MMAYRFVVAMFVSELLVGGQPLAEASSQVGQYELLQIELTSTHTYANPFRDTSVSATFTHTDTAGTVQVHGFHDGGSAWRVRFMPHLLGQWSYTTSSPDAQLNGQMDSFECVASTNHGPLRTQGYHFFHTDGTPFFWNGDCEWFLLSESFSQQQRLDAVAFLASKKVNNLVMIMVNDDTHDVYPWQGSDPSNVDYWRFNAARLQEWEGVVATLKANGIIADLWFYSDDSSHLTSGVGAGTDKEDHYFNHMIDRFSAYSNVTWNLGLEYEDYRSSSWVRSRAAYVKTRDPYDHLIGVHETDDAWDFYGDVNLDHPSLQHLADSPAHLNSQVIAQRQAAVSAGRAIPICHEEFFIEGLTSCCGDLDQGRRGMWAVTCAGGFYKVGSLGFWIGTPYMSAQHFDLAKYLFEFISEGTAGNPGRIRWWEMAPNNSVVQQDRTRYALAKIAGSESTYLIYSEGGASFGVDLSGASGSLPVRWLDPRTGVVTPGGWITGGGQQTLTTPGGDQEMALLIGRRDGAQPLPGPAAAPNPPDRAEGVSRNPSLSWTAGDGALSHDVYFGPTPAPTFQVSQAGASFNPGQLDAQETYFWQIDEVNEAGTTTGEVWSFRTMSPPGDTDGDGDVDQEDFGRLQACFSDQGHPPVPPECLLADINKDTTVDAHDVNALLGCMSGAHVPADQDCFP